jgi:hypothetical protein
MYIRTVYCNVLLVYEYDYVLHTATTTVRTYVQVYGYATQTTDDDAVRSTKIRDDLLDHSQIHQAHRAKQATSQ